MDITKFFYDTAEYGAWVEDILHLPLALRWFASTSELGAFLDALLLLDLLGLCFILIPLMPLANAWHPRLWRRVMRESLALFTGTWAIKILVRPVLTRDATTDMN